MLEAWGLLALSGSLPVRASTRWCVRDEEEPSSPMAATAGWDSRASAVVLSISVEPLRSTQAEGTPMGKVGRRRVTPVFLRPPSEPDVRGPPVPYLRPK